MRFLQPACDARLTLHPLPEYRVAAHSFGHQLDRDGPAFARVLSLVDLAHPAATEKSLEVVGPELRPGA